MAVRAAEFEEASATTRIASEQYWLRNDLGYNDGPVIGRAVGAGDVQLPLLF
jgi:hypothetical protein